MVWLYFVAITCMLTFLFMGLFVAVVTDTFGRVRQRRGAAFLSSDQYERQSTAWADENISPYPADDDEDGVSVRDLARRVRRSPLFHTAISVIILANCLYLAVLDVHASQALLDSMEYMIPVFTVCFTIEVLVHYVASGSASKDVTTGSNVMDYVVLLFMVIGLVSGERVMQFLSSLHIFRLMRYFPTLQDLFTSALASSRSFVNLIVFVTIVGFTCAITGMYIFRDRVVSDIRADFSNVKNAILTIFKVRLCGEHIGIGSSSSTGSG